MSNGEVEYGQAHDEVCKWRSTESSMSTPRRASGSNRSNRESLEVEKQDKD